MNFSKVSFWIRDKKKLEGFSSFFYYDEEKDD
jgi:hypothetical protein